jgi:uncharacterized membrane protein YphA (DoxX/SURF4 family)
VGADHVAALTMGLAGFSKYASAVQWQARFVSWGYPGRAFVTGALEMAGAVLLLVPRLSVYAAGMLACIMLAALTTVLTHPGELTWTASFVQLVIMNLIIALRIVRRPGR